MNSLLQCGSVASLRGYENPISVARLIMQDPEQHIFYAQDYAAEIAREHQIRTLEECELGSNLSTNDSASDTVGSIAIDSEKILQQEPVPGDGCIALQVE